MCDKPQHDGKETKENSCWQLRQPEHKESQFLHTYEGDQ
jgi:hypothetical protein